MEKHYLGAEEALDFSSVHHHVSKGRVNILSILKRVDVATPGAFKLEPIFTRLFSYRVEKARELLGDKPKKEADLAGWPELPETMEKDYWKPTPALWGFLKIKNSYVINALVNSAREQKRTELAEVYDDLTKLFLNRHYYSPNGIKVYVISAEAAADIARTAIEKGKIKNPSDELLAAVAAGYLPCDAKVKAVLATRGGGRG